MSWKELAVRAADLELADSIEGGGFTARVTGKGEGGHVVVVCKTGSDLEFGGRRVYVTGAGEVFAIPPTMTVAVFERRLAIRASQVV